MTDEIIFSFGVKKKSPKQVLLLYKILFFLQCRPQYAICIIVLYYYIIVPNTVQKSQCTHIQIPMMQQVLCYKSFNYTHT